MSICDTLTGLGGSAYSDQLRFFFRRFFSPLTLGLLGCSEANALLITDFSAVFNIHVAFFCTFELNSDTNKVAVHGAVEV